MARRDRRAAAANPRTSSGALRDEQAPPPRATAGPHRSGRRCCQVGQACLNLQQKVAADDAVIDSKVSLVPNESRGFDVAVELDVMLPSIDDEAAAIEVVKAAHKVCPYSNATRGNIDVTLTANGQAV